ncbi:hypothetical protein ACLUWI_07005 [Limosilactobacillus mucosae]|uniref:hypothetical protein n=1 Tax=Limosilactobacillus mucosae TaxID=97478 RepID=UPI00399330D4
MPKQGQFAKSFRPKKLNDFKVKRHSQGAVIDETQMTDFLTIRFALTIKKKLPIVQRESAQRLLQEIASRLRNQDGRLTDLMAELIVELNAKTPWQFFWQISDFWPVLQKFLQKEVPAVPLSQRILIKQTLSQAELERLLGQALAKKTAAAMLLGQDQAETEKINQLAVMMMADLYEETHLNWQKVRQLLAPFKFSIDNELDETTKQWLRDLTAL